MKKTRFYLLSKKLCTNPERLLSFTITELMIVMIISAFVLAVAYLSLSFMSKQYLRFAENSQNLAKVNQIQNILEQDFQKSKVISFQKPVLFCQYDSLTITYEFMDEYLIRKQLTLSDTFNFTCTDFRFYMLGKELFDKAATVDEISFLLFLKGDALPVHIKKDYDAVTLFERIGNH